MQSSTPQASTANVYLGLDFVMPLDPLMIGRTTKETPSSTYSPSAEEPLSGNGEKSDSRVASLRDGNEDVGVVGS